MTYIVPYHAKGVVALKDAVFTAVPIRHADIRMSSITVEASFRYCIALWGRQRAEHDPTQAEQMPIPLTTWAAGRLPCADCVRTNQKCRQVGP